MSQAAVPLLFELGCEELPAARLSELATALTDGVLDQLAERGIAVDRSSVETFYTPRRLSFIARAVPLTGPDQQVERRGPAVTAAFGPDGAPSKALLGFAQSCGVSVDALERLETNKGSWFVHRSNKPGAQAKDVLIDCIAAAIKALPIAKPMRWGIGEHSFLRPVHWLLLTLDDVVVPGRLFDVESGNQSFGHRFHAPQAITISNSADYVALLHSAYVMVKPAARRQKISDEATAKAARTGGGVSLSEALLDEVVSLTEWPVAIQCEIPAEFMRLPAQTLITTIETHQRFFPIVADGQLRPAFIGIANVESRDPAEIRKGYERVVRPRLADAAFFFDQDLKTPLADHQALLRNVSFQAKLGTLWDKSERIASLAETIALQIGAEPALAVRAAELSKCDLMTRMVGEFPELQGVMGRTYALAQDEDPQVAVALDEIYSPRQAASAVAGSELGRVLAIADRLDTLACSFAIGAKPTGSKDPYSLRRAALGLARTLIEGGVRVDLQRLLEQAVLQVPAQTAKDYLGKLSQVLPDNGPLALIRRRVKESATAPAVYELYAFILERLRAYYADRGIAHGVFQAVAEKHPQDLVDFDQRIHAVAAFVALPEADDLAAAFKRTRNILRKADGERIAEKLDPTLFEHDAERALFAELEMARTEVVPLFAARDYAAGLVRLAQLQPALAGFFDAVMVMAEDPAVRANRLGLLQNLLRTCQQVADLSEL